MGDREGANQAGKADGATREEEATSAETLDDLARAEGGSAAKSGDTSSGASDSASSSTPSPDGAFDAPHGGRADGSDAGEPM
jgi:hypothetical protein